MTYSEAINRIEEIVESMEQSGVISLEEYIKREKEVKQLLLFCKKKLGALSEQVNDKSINFS